MTAIPPSASCALVEDLAPVGRLEELIVERIAVLHWRLRRLYRAEASEILTAEQTFGWRPVDLDAQRADCTRRRGTDGQGLHEIVDSPMPLHVALTERSHGSRMGEAEPPTLRPETAP